MERVTTTISFLKFIFNQVVRYLEHLCPLLNHATVMFLIVVMIVSLTDQLMKLLPVLKEEEIIQQKHRNNKVSCENCGIILYISVPSQNAFKKYLASNLELGVEYNSHIFLYFQLHKPESYSWKEFDHVTVLSFER